MTVFGNSRFIGNSGSGRLFPGALAALAILALPHALTPAARAAEAAPAGAGSRMTIAEHGHTVIAPRTGKSKAGSHGHAEDRTIHTGNGGNDGTLVLTQELGERTINVVEATDGFVTDSPTPTVAPPSETSVSAPGVGAPVPTAVYNGIAVATGTTNTVNSTTVSSGDSGATVSSPDDDGSAPGRSGSAPGRSGSAPGHDGDSPGNSGNAPGHSGGHGHGH